MQGKGKGNSQTDRRMSEKQGPVDSMWSWGCRLRKCMSRGQRLGEGDIRRGSRLLGVKAKSRTKLQACSCHLLALSLEVGFSTALKRLLFASENIEKSRGQAEFFMKQGDRWRGLPGSLP